MGIKVDDLYGEQTSATTDVELTLNHIEKKLMTQNYRQAVADLAQIDETQIESLPAKSQFFCTPRVS